MRVLSTHGFPSRAWRVALNADGSDVYVVTFDGLFALGADGAPRWQRPSREATDQLYGVEVSPTGSWVAVAEGRHLVLHDPRDGAERERIYTAIYTGRLRWTADERSLWMGGATLRRFGRDGLLHADLGATKNAGEDLDLSVDGSVIASVRGKSLSLWDAQTNELRKTQTVGGVARAVALTADAQSAWVATAEGLTRWELTRKKRLALQTVPLVGVQFLRRDARAQSMLVATHDRLLHLSLADASTLAEAPLDGAIVDDLALAADGRTALTTHLLARKTDGHMALVRRWDLAASSGG